MLLVEGGDTNISVEFKVIDSTDGTPEEGVVAATAGLVLWYRRDAAVLTSLATITNLALLTTAHTDKGILHIDDGVYRLDLPDAAVAAGVKKVTWGGTATGMIVLGGTINIVSFDPYDAVRMGQTALPNAAADAAGGLPISDAGGLDMDAILVDTGTTLQAELDAIQAAVITNAAGADIAADIIAIKAETASIVADTGELQTDWVDGGRLDALLDATIRALAAGTAQAGTSSTIQLASAETFADDELNGCCVNITSGTGAGQSRVISDYVNSTDTATVTPNWTTSSDATSVYNIVNGSVNVEASGINVPSDLVSITQSTVAATNLKKGSMAAIPFLAQTGSTATVLQTDLSGTITDMYNDRSCYATDASGVVFGQGSKITAYDSGTNALTVQGFTHAPANGNPFVII